MRGRERNEGGREGGDEPDIILFILAREDSSAGKACYESMKS